MSKVSADDIFPVKKVWIEIDVPLDASATEQRGMRAAQLQGTLEAVETELEAAKAVVKQKAKRIEEIGAEIRELQRQIREHSGKAMVRGEERANFSNNTVETIVMEGPAFGLVVNPRAMTDDERQLAIDVDLPTDAPTVKAKKGKPKPDAASAAH